MCTRNVSEILKHGINKQTFSLKPVKCDGLLLQIHHTTRDAKKRAQRIRFTHSAYNDEGTILAAADHNGNIFVIDFARNKIWCVQVVASCTVLKFSTLRRNEILVGLNSGIVQIVDIERGEAIGSLNGHTYPVHDLSISNSLCISSSAYESVIWDLNRYVKLQVLTLDDENGLKCVSFMPVTNDVLACFRDDTMYVWKYDSFESFKQISPAAWNKRSIRTVAFTKDGRAMVVGGYSNKLFVFIIDTWTFARSVALPNYIQTVKTLSFLSQPFDGGCNKILCVLAGSGTLYFFDMTTSEVVNKIAKEQTIKRFVCSDNGKLIACTFTTGEINVYNVARLFTTPIVEDEDVVERNTCKIKLRRKSSSGLVLQRELSDLLELDKLQSMLKEFGEYPDRFRTTIWMNVLKLPINKQQYNCFINYKSHDIVDDIDRKYTLENRCMLKNLKKLISNLVVWCPFLSVVEFLPAFVFPFVKIFINDPLVCFEAICTIIINWCQHWFEYFPLPPLNILALIENLLVEHDPELLNHLTKLEVTSQIYALPLLETAFSEILTSTDWCILWDHIISNEPSYLLMVVVTYSIQNRAALATLSKLDDFVYFYRNQNPIDIKKLVNKSYNLLNATKSPNHPRQYLKYFKKLDAGPYPKYVDYPRTGLRFDTDIVVLKSEERKLKSNESLLQKLRLSDGQHLANLVKREEEIKRIQILEKQYKKKLDEGQESVAQQRAKVSALRKSVYQQQISLLNSTKDKILEQNDKRKTFTIEGLINDLDANRNIEGLNLVDSEQEMLKHYAELLRHKLKIEALLSDDLELNCDSDSKEKEILRKQQIELSDKIRKVREKSLSTVQLKQLNIVTGLMAIDKLIQKIQTQFETESSLKKPSLIANGSKMKTLQLETETKELELDIKQLLQKLADMKIMETTEKLDNSIDTKKINATSSTEQCKSENKFEAVDKSHVHKRSDSNKRFGVSQKLK